jgi:hypothetical protein
MKQSESIAALATALAKANLEIRNAELDCENKHFKGKYASLGSLIAAVKVPLAKHGLSIVQTVNTENGVVFLTNKLIHSSGEWIEDSAGFPILANTNIQQLGALITYLRRYTISTMTGIVGDEDDDGEMDRVNHKEAEEQRKAMARRSPPQQAERRAPAPSPAPAEEAPAAPVKALNDRFPEEGDFPVIIRKVVRRKGKPIAVLVESEDYGTCFVSTTVEGYGDFLTERIDEELTLGMQRNGVAMEIMHIRSPTAASTPAPASAQDDDVPF